MTTLREALHELVARQASDEALWFQAQYASEAYLQAALRELHGAVEGLSSEQSEQPVAWLEVGPPGEILGVTLTPDGFLETISLYTHRADRDGVIEELLEDCENCISLGMHWAKSPDQVANPKGHSEFMAHCLETLNRLRSIKQKEPS